MFEPSDQFFSRLQLNNVIYEKVGIIVQEAIDVQKRRKFVLIQRRTSDEAEYRELHKEILSFNKSSCPYILKIHKYTYDLLLSDDTSSLSSYSKKPSNEKVFKRENLRSNVTSLKEYSCKVKVCLENFVVDESAALGNKIKFVPIFLISVFNSVPKQRTTSLLDKQQRYVAKRRHTLKIHAELLKIRATPLSSLSSIPQKMTPANPSKHSSSTTNLHILFNEDLETKYIRQLLELSLNLGSLPDNPETVFEDFNEDSNDLQMISMPLFQDVCSTYRNIAYILSAMFRSAYQENKNNPYSLANICADLRKINDLESNSSEITSNTGLLCLNQSSQLPSLKLIGLSKDGQQQQQSNFKQTSQQTIALRKQPSIASFCTSEQITCPSLNSQLQSMKSMKSFSNYQSNSSMTSIFGLQSEKIVASSSSSQGNWKTSNIEIYDIEHDIQKKPKRFKCLAFFIPFKPELNVVHARFKTNPFIEKIEVSTHPDEEPLIIPRNHSTVTMCGVGQYKVYLLGGSRSIKMYEFDSENTREKQNIMVERSSMLAEFERKGFGTCANEKENSILIASGIKDGILTDSCEVYDVETNTWNTIASVKVPTEGCSLCIFNQMAVYKFGGIDGNGKVSKVVEKYEFYSDTWTIIQFDTDYNSNSQIQFGVNMLSVQINHNQIMLFGGEQSGHLNGSPFYDMSEGNRGGGGVTKKSKGIVSPSDLSRAVYFFHIDKNQHHEFFGSNEQGLPEGSGYVLPGQVTISDAEVILLSKSVVRQNRLKILGFSAKNTFRKLRSDEIFF